MTSFEAAVMLGLFAWTVSSAGFLAWLAVRWLIGRHIHRGAP